MLLASGRRAWCERDRLRPHAHHHGAFADAGGAVVRCRSRGPPIGRTAPTSEAFLDKCRGNPFRGYIINCKSRARVHEISLRLSGGRAFSDARSIRTTNTPQKVYTHPSCLTIVQGSLVYTLQPSCKARLLPFLAMRLAHAAGTAASMVSLARSLCDSALRSRNQQRPFARISCTTSQQETPRFLSSGACCTPPTAEPPTGCSFTRRIRIGIDHLGVVFACGRGGTGSDRHDFIGS